jgi:hypothetical protein
MTPLSAVRLSNILQLECEEFFLIPNKDTGLNSAEAASPELEISSAPCSPLRTGRFLVYSPGTDPRSPSTTPFPRTRPLNIRSSPLAFSVSRSASRLFAEAFAAPAGGAGSAGPLSGILKPRFETTLTAFLTHSPEVSFRPFESSRTLDLERFITSERLVPYFLIDSADLYKLFIDQKRWVDPRGGVFLTDKTFDVREPGYMMAMKKAFQFLMSAPKGAYLCSEYLNPSFLEELHALAVEGVNSVRRQDNNPEGEIISSEPLRMGFRIPGDRNVESFGLKKGFEAVPGETSGATVSSPGVHQLVNKLKDHVYSYTIDESPDTFFVFDDAVANSKEFKDHVKKRTELPTSIKLRPVPSGASLEPSILTIIQAFLETDKITEEEKLQAVATLVQNLDQLHPFYDGNIRVFALLLINRLLFDLNLTPTCLEDPNCVDCLSIEEIIIEIRKGQAHFLSLKSL